MSVVREELHLLGLCQCKMMWVRYVSSMRVAGGDHLKKRGRCTGGHISDDLVSAITPIVCKVSIETETANRIYKEMKDRQASLNKVTSNQGVVSQLVSTLQDEAHLTA